METINIEQVNIPRIISNGENFKLMLDEVSTPTREVLTRLDDYMIQLNAVLGDITDRKYSLKNSIVQTFSEYINHSNYGQVLEELEKDINLKILLGAENNDSDEGFFSSLERILENKKTQTAMTLMNQSEEKQKQEQKLSKIKDKINAAQTEYNILKVQYNEADKSLFSNLTQRQVLVEKQAQIEQKVQQDIAFYNFSLALQKVPATLNPLKNPLAYEDKGAVTGLFEGLAYGSAFRQLRTMFLDIKKDSLWKQKLKAMAQYINRRDVDEDAFKELENSSLKISKDKENLHSQLIRQELLLKQLLSEKIEIENSVIIYNTYANEAQNEDKFIYDQSVKVIQDVLCQSDYSITKFCLNLTRNEYSFSRNINSDWKQQWAKLKTLLVTSIYISRLEILASKLYMKYIPNIRKIEKQSALFKNTTAQQREDMEVHLNIPGIHQNIVDMNKSSLKLLAHLTNSLNTIKNFTHSPSFVDYQGDDENLLLYILSYHLLLTTEDKKLILQIMGIQKDSVSNIQLIRPFLNTKTISNDLIPDKLHSLGDEITKMMLTNLNAMEIVDGFWSKEALKISSLDNLEGFTLTF